MWTIETGDPGQLSDCEAFLTFLNRLPHHGRSEARGLLSGDGPVTVTRAPGRLDVMGGIADYSGSLVLQLPLACATLCATQPRSDPLVRVFSASPSVERYACIDPSSQPEPWCAYILGILAIWKETGFDPPHGLDIVIRSEVPEGAGISSSAALEVAAARGLSEVYGISRQPLELALECQRVENEVVGAACGAMDQVTAACGERDRLLRLLCQPAEIQGHLAIPPGLALWGIDSGVRHSVAGTTYESVRTAAFMGLRILSEEAGADPPGGYLANVPVERLDAAVLPELMTGREFLERYSGTTDTVTRVEPGRSYPVRAATAHPVREHRRIRSFADGLDAGRPEALGKLMYESHESYTSCGLGSPETDLIVQLARKSGPGSGIYGAKITGGGSGGTVAILAAAEAGSTFQALAARYREQSGQGGHVLSGSSPGAASFGTLRLGHP